MAPQAVCWLFGAATNLMDPISKARQADRPTVFKPGNPTRFAPGISGNPSGRPKEAYISKRWKRMFRKKAILKEVDEITMDVLRSRRMSSVLLLREIIDRLEGSVGDTLDVNVNVAYADAVARIRARKKAKNESA
jgi:hypothetical protein